jgi:hypothetical protein
MEPTNKMAESQLHRKHRWAHLAAFWLTILGVEPIAAATYCVDPAAPTAGTGACWSAPFQRLEAALAAAAASAGSDEIWLRSGTYVPAPPASGDRRAAHFALVNGVAIYGGFAGNETQRSARNADAASNGTVLSGDVLGDDGANFANRNDNVNTVVRMDTALATATLDGFSIRGGFAAALNSPADAYGGGLSIRRGLVHLRGVHFVDNEAVNAGGAVSIDANTGTDGATFVYCEFRANRVSQDFDTAGGGGALWMKTVYPVAITHSRFLGNQCTFAGCRGGAVRMQILNQSPRGLISHSVFSGNRVPEPGLGGGALWVDGQGAELVHLTFSENYDGTTLQAIRMRDHGLVDISNSIIDGGLVRVGFGTLGIAHSLVNRCGSAQPAPGPGLPSDCNAVDNGGNLRASLGFVDALGGDQIAGTADDNLRLVIGAAAIDRGNNTLIGADVNDSDGDGITNEATPLDLARVARRADVHGQPDAGSGAAPQVDLGAYETVGAHVAFETSGSSVIEGTDSFAVARVRLTTVNGAPLDSAVSVTASSVDGSAVANVNYSGGVQILSYAVGAPSGSTQNAVFGILNNLTPQPTLDFRVQLSAASNSTLVAPATHTVQILDNDGVSVLDASARSGDVLRIPVTLPSEALQPVLIQYQLTSQSAIAGVHFSPTTTPVLIPVGARGAEIPITTFPSADGQTRTLLVVLTSASGLVFADPVAVGTIVSPTDAVFASGFE